MNNSHFRNLIASTNTTGQASNGTPAPSKPSSAQQPFKTPALGSRMRSSIPMTPRSVAGYNPHNDFARQVAEQRRELDGQPPAKKFKSTSAPKGTRLARGYQDRARLRDELGEEDDKEKRLKALEEMLKLQQIDQATFDHLRSEIGVGGSVESTHLVKGLDWKLLEKVKKGEDVNGQSTQDDGKHEEEGDDEMADVDGELDSALQREVAVVEKAADMQDDSPAVTAETADKQVLSRDEILRRLKESRSKNSQKSIEPEPILSDRFKKVGSNSKIEKKKFTEVVNGRRRDVLITTDKDGRTKRKVKWLDPPGEGPHAGENQVQQQPLGMEVPAELAAKQQALIEAQKAEEADDDDIFAGVGADYDPLAEIGDDEDDEAVPGVDKIQKSSGEEPPGTGEASQPKSRNYFSAPTTTEVGEDTLHPGAQDPTILAAIKRAAALRKAEEEGHNGEEQDGEKSSKNQELLKKLKQSQADDARDLDLGFGESRFGDEEDEDGPLWDEEDKKGGRKRGRKRRKGDKDSVQDVLGLLEGRRK